MSWRIALVILIGIPGLTILAQDAAAVATALSFGIFCYPLILLSLWQMARRISQRAFEGSAAAQEPREAHRETVEIARVLDGKKDSVPPALPQSQISAAVCESAVRSTRFKLTAVEGLVVGFLLLTIVSLAVVFLQQLGKHKSPLSDTQATATTPRKLDSGPSQIPEAIQPSPEQEAGYTRQAAARTHRSEPTRVLARAPVSQTVRGRDLGYTLQLPAGWTTKKGTEGLEVYDTLCVCKSMYVGVIAEEAQAGTPEKVASLARERLKKVATDIYWSQPQPIVLEDRNWLDFVVRCRVEETPVGFEFYVYSGPEGTFQIIGWTSQNLFDRDADLLRTVMQTFRFPSSR
jgi:hypothetical protein